MSPRRGGQSTQSGIFYQNSVAALFLGRLCDNADSPLEQQVIQVRVETPDKVDDIVVKFADEHKLFIQAKENIVTSDKAWKKLWQDFEAQYLDSGFNSEVDRLKLQMGRERSELRTLQSLCEHASTALSPDEWMKSLSSVEKKLLEKIRPILSFQFWNDDTLWTFFRHIEIGIWTLTQRSDTCLDACDQ